MNTSTFDTWFAKQLDEGLVDIKFAVMAGKGVSVEAIHGELLAAEGAINAGFRKEAPRATSMIPSDVMAVIHSTAL